MTDDQDTITPAALPDAGTTPPQPSAAVPDVGTAPPYPPAAVPDVGTGSSSSAEAAMIPKARFDQVNAKRKVAELKHATTAEELAGLTGRFNDLEKSMLIERRQRQALEIATANGIGEWAGDLRGGTVEEIQAHAAQIKERLDRAIRSSTAGTPAPAGGRPAPTVDLNKLKDHKWVSNNPKAALDMELERQRNGSN